MMEQPSYPPSLNPVSVIGSQYISPNPFEVMIVKNSSGDRLITDVNHNTMFRVTRRRANFHEQHLLLDADNRPIVMIRKKIMSAHSGWKAFKGNSIADSDMIFSTKTPKIIQSKTEVHVFLQNKTSSSNDSCDFKITGCWSKRNFSIFIGDSETLIAEMHKMEATENVRHVKDKFMVKFFPNVDYAFVVTLVAILEAMKSSDMDKDDAGGVVLQSIGGLGILAGAFVS